MKKLITLGLSVFALSSQVFGYSGCCQDSCFDNCCPSPTCCYYPCDDCNNDCGFGGCCRPGFYIGGEAGYAWIQTPTNDCPENIVIFDDYESVQVDSHRGHFAWGVFAGYNRRICNSCFFLGIEGGYNDSGFSKLNFTAHHPIVLGDDRIAFHHLKMHSRDWNISATATYCFCDSFDVFVKVGGARVRESFTFGKHGHCEDIYYGDHDIADLFCKDAHTSWAAVVKAGLGYSIFDCLNIYAAYRGVFCKKCDSFQGHFENIGTEYEPLFRLKNCTKVHAVYGGLAFTF